MFAKFHKKSPYPKTKLGLMLDKTATKFQRLTIFNGLMRPLCDKSMTLNTIDGKKLCAIAK